MSRAPRVAERRAAELLKQQGIMHAPVNAEALAKAVGAEVQYERMEPNVSGLLVRTPQGHVRIGVNATHHRNRQRFTIAHEIGHHLLHAKSSPLFVDDQMVYYREDSSTAASPDPREVQANAFAAALLMPEAFLRADLSGGIDFLDEVAVKNLAERYQVSQQSLTIRLVNLGLISGIETSQAPRRG